MSSRASADAAVGMMDAAYFIGRKELLEFFNELLELNLTKIEQTASGAIACQITELIFPGSIPMTRVDWEARSDYEFIQNYKLLQNAFNKHHVQRYVDVDKLIRAKYQDNLEFCQWLKAFYDQSGVFHENYDPVAVRARGKGGKKYNEIHSNGRKAGANAGANNNSNNLRRPRPAGVGTGGPPSMVARAANPRSPAKASAASIAEKAALEAAAIRNSRPLRERPEKNNLADADAIPLADPNLIRENAELKLQVSELESTVKDLEANVTTLEEAVLETEQERQFYFEKLRNVEVMLQVYQENAGQSDPEHLIEKIFKILYATAEDKLTVNDEGEVLEGAEVPEEPVDGV